jgi:hypothetical protein
MSNSDLDEQQEERQQEVIVIQTDDEIIRAGTYLMMRDMGDTMMVIAERFGYSTRQGMYDLVARWDKSGVLAKAREQFIVPKYEEVKVAYSNVLNNWPKVIARVLNIALYSDSDRVGVEAAAWLKQNVVDPELASRLDAGAAEMAFARRSGDSNPLEITLPKLMAKSVPNIKTPPATKPE